MFKLLLITFSFTLTTPLYSQNIDNPCFNLSILNHKATLECFVSMADNDYDLKNKKPYILKIPITNEKKCQRACKENFLYKKMYNQLVTNLFSNLQPRAIKHLKKFNFFLYNKPELDNKTYRLKRKITYCHLPVKWLRKTALKFFKIKPKNHYLPNELLKLCKLHNQNLIPTLKRLRKWTQLSDKLVKQHCENKACRKNIIIR